MPGIATQFEILRLTIDDLIAAGDPNGVAQAMNDHLPYAHLGAIGPSLGDFLTAPFPEEAPYPEDYKTLWRRVFNVIGKKEPPGLYYVLNELNDVLDTVGTVADNKDCDGLVDLRDDGIEERIEDITQQFASAVANVQTEALEIAGLIGSGLKPAITTESPLDPIPSPSNWDSRDFLHWNNTGKFVTALLKTADENSDPQLRAYAYGYLISYAGRVCAAGHINSIVGGPARTQWWRQRFVMHYIDAWVYGFYNQSPTPTFSGDTPTPDYASGDWPDLCSANLQQRIELGAMDPEELMDLTARAQDLPAFIPADFANNWSTAANIAFGEMPPGIDAQALNSAYVFTWLMLWFQTSSAILGCNKTPPLVPPEGCGESPTELDPFVNGVPLDGVIPQPPPANIDADVDLLAVICGIILAIIGGLLILTGNIVLGGAAIAGAVALFDCDNATDLDWQEIRCLIFWERMYLHNALLGIHRLLALSAIDYPYAKELASDSDYQDLFPLLEAWETGKNLTKSKTDKSFPGKAWDGSLFTFNRPPTTFESPETIAYRDIAYPNFFVDDDANNPLSNGRVAQGTPTETAADGGEYAVGTAVTHQLPKRFGNAVANAVDLLNTIGSGELPDWNLDADRGLAYLNWEFQFTYIPDDVRIKPW